MASTDFPPSAVKAVVQEVAALLKEREETVSVAETVNLPVRRLRLFSLRLTDLEGCRWHHISITSLRRGSKRLLQGRPHGTTTSHRSVPFATLSDRRLSQLQLYSLDSRLAYGGWKPDTIQAYRGPTPAIVSGLATNVRGTLQSTYTVCESGTAGPGGGATKNRTPGFVALAVACERGTYTREVETGVPKGEAMREANMVEFAKAALTLLRDVIKGEAGEPVEKL